jgi:hypothetical protein
MSSLIDRITFAATYNTFAMKKLYTLTVGTLLGLSAVAQVSLDHVSTYRTGVFDDGAAEIVSYDSASQKLVFTNASTNEIEFLDFSDPTSLTSIEKVDLSSYGGGINSVAVYNGVVAVAVEADVKQDNGAVVFFTMNGDFISQVTVGALPDMVTFSPDGNLVITANEGEPSSDYLVDPEGTVSIIDVSGGVTGLSQADVTTLGFDGVTIPADVRIFGPDELVAFEDDFQDEDTIQFDTNFNNWSVYNLQGSSRTWGEYALSSAPDQLYARISGFDNGCQTQEDFFVSNNFSLQNFDDAVLNFSSGYNFGGNFPELLVSTNYTEGGDVLAATWDTITSSVTWPSVDGYTWQQSGDIDLSAYVGNASVSIAFLYTANTDSCRTIQLDSIQVTGSVDLTAETNLEPEYVTVSDDSKTAYVVLQENNGLAIIDLETKTISSVVGLGFKDHSTAGNGLDPSNRDDTIHIRNYNVKGMYQPDAIAYYMVNGQGYVVSANEGDSRDYDAYSEEERVKDLDLDPAAYPDAATIQENEELGRLKTTIANGDANGDGLFEEIYSYGARSFSIWNGTSGDLVWDSGDEFEQKTAEAYPDDFNSNNDENDSFENRSDDKGPEPEAVEIIRNFNNAFALVGLERMGGIMVYDITDPTNPSYIEYVNNRDFSVADATSDAAGDLGVEDILYISDVKSPNGKHYAVTSNEVSGTISVFEISGLIPTGTEDAEGENVAWNVYPNPTTGVIRTNVVDNYEVYSIAGALVGQFNQTQEINLTQFESGLYLVKNTKGDVVRVSKH